MQRRPAAVTALVCLAVLAALAHHARTPHAQQIATHASPGTRARPNVVSHFSSRAIADLPAMQRGASMRPAHPNEALPDTALGQRIHSRPLPIPTLTVGTPRTFQFDGRRRGWALSLSSQLLTTATYGRGHVFVGAGFSSRTVYALDARTGHVDWEGATPDGGPTAAIVDDDKVYFNTESCTIFAFNARTGARAWSRWLGDPLMSQPAAAAGLVFSAYPSHGGFAFTALATADGNPTWDRRIDADVITAPVIAGESVYFSTMEGTVYRFRARDGQLQWSRALEATSAPAVFQDRLYVAQRVAGGQERQLVLATSDGHTMVSGDATPAAYAAQRANSGGVMAGWSYEGSRPTYADGRLYYAMGNQLMARDAETGRVVWQRTHALAANDRGMTSPSIVGSVLVVGTREGDLFGLDIDTGETTWAYNVGEPIAFQPTVANGWAYVTTARGRVIGVEIGDATFDGWHQWGGNAVHNGPAARDPLPPEAPSPTHGTLRAVGADGRPFPTMRTTVHADVSGIVARVEVEQSFSNPFDHPVDAEYLFPLPSDAAVDAMEMRIGARVVRGDIRRRDEARQVYNAARAAGRTAALLEQERPNLFRQSVANVRPGETVRVALRFAQTVPFENGRYEFAFPLATGSRYTPGQGGATPTRPDGDVDMHVRVDLGLPLAEVSSPSHAITASADGSTAQTVALTAGAARPDRDYVLRYRPRVQQIAPAVLATRNGNEGFFTLALHPDVAVAEADIASRELVFVVDTSSSMRGAPLAHAQAVMRRAIERLRPTDTFRVVRFSDQTAELSPAPLVATDANRTRALEFVQHLQAAGATDMMPGLQVALRGSVPRGVVRMVVLLTDGYIGNESQVLAAVSRDLGTARVFAFGVGAAVNRYLLERLTEVGRGHLEVVLPSEDAQAAADRFHTFIARPLLTDVRIDWAGLDVGDVYPRTLPDLFADRPLVVHGRFGRAGDGDVRITGVVRGQPWARTVHVSLPARADDHEALPSVWARARMHDLENVLVFGETAELRTQMTTLGLSFGMVTPYTSFVAVDDAPAATVAAATRAGALHAAGTTSALTANAQPFMFTDDQVGGAIAAAEQPAAFRMMAGATGGGSSAAAGAPMAVTAPTPTIVAPPAGPAPSVPVATDMPMPSAGPAGGRTAIARTPSPVRDDSRGLLLGNGAVRACLARPGGVPFHGGITLRLGVASDGSVMRVEIVSAQPLPPEVSQCITAAASLWQLGAQGTTRTVLHAMSL